MLDKRELQYRLSRMRHIKTWQLLLILFFGILVAATFLRLNNLGMVERREAVLKADKAGDVAAARKSLVELQSYVAGHMNTSLGPNGVQLATIYNRDLEAALSQASDGSNPQSAVYQQASVECRAKWQGGVESFRNDYVQCVIARVSSLTPDQGQSTLTKPNPALYTFNYASPLWTPDLAGFSVLFCLIILLIILIRIVTKIVLRMLLKHRFKSI